MENLNEGLTVTKADLALALQERNEMTPTASKEFVDTFLSVVTDSLRRGEGVELRGLGSFRIRHRKGREGKNPRTGDLVVVKPKRIAYFKLGKDLRYGMVAEKSER